MASLMAFFLAIFWCIAYAVEIAAKKKKTTIAKVND